MLAGSECGFKNTDNKKKVDQRQLVISFYLVCVCENEENKFLAELNAKVFSQCKKWVKRRKTMTNVVATDSSDG